MKEEAIIKMNDPKKHGKRIRCQVSQSIWLYPVGGAAIGRPHFPALRPGPLHHDSLRQIKLAPTLRETAIDDNIKEVLRVLTRNAI